MPLHQSHKIQKRGYEISGIPSIRIEAKHTGEWVRITVQDDGIGIPEVFRKRLFGVFQHASDPQGGTGIGLAIVRKTVERMGGRVGVISQPDHGSQFWIELKPASRNNTEVFTA